MELVRWVISAVLGYLWVGVSFINALVVLGLRLRGNWTTSMLPVVGTACGLAFLMVVPLAVSVRVWLLPVAFLPDLFSLAEAILRKRANGRK